MIMTTQSLHMKVAFFTHYPELYGANRSLLNLIDGLTPLGVQSFVIVPEEGEILSALRERAIPFVITPHHWWLSDVTLQEGLRCKIVRYITWRRASFSRLTANLRILPQVVRQLKDWDIDIIYANSSVIPLGALAAFLMGKPHVWHLREFGYLDYNLTPDWGKTLGDFVLNRADAKICVSEALCAHYLRGLENDTYHVVYNGVATKAEMESYHHNTALRTSDDKVFVFALVGLILPGKRQETAIMALALLKESTHKAHLIIAGGGDTRLLEELAASCGVTEQITFWGYAKNPFDVYFRSDAVLMCSKNEAMGRVTVEAMAAAKPVIGYNSGGTAELISHEFNGLLYEGGERELATCMLRLMEQPVWAREMGENGWRSVREKFTVETYAGSIYKILAGLPGRMPELHIP